MCNLREKLKHLKGQPIEIITESGFEFCGIDIETDDDIVILIDDSGRFVCIRIDHIDALIEPQMVLKHLCSNNDCNCNGNGNGNNEDYRRRCCCCG